MWRACRLRASFFASPLLLVLLVNTRAVESRRLVRCDARDRSCRVCGVSLAGRRAGAFRDCVVPFRAGRRHAALGLAWHAHHRVGRHRGPRRVGRACRRDRARSGNLTPAQFHHPSPADGRDDRPRRPGRRVRGLARQAARPAGILDGARPGSPDPAPSEMLAQASKVLEAPRTLLVWEQTDEPWTEVALWLTTVVLQGREPPGTFGDIVATRGGGQLLLPQPGGATAADVHSRPAQPRDLARPAYRCRSAGALSYHGACWLAASGA